MIRSLQLTCFILAAFYGQAQLPNLQVSGNRQQLIVNGVPHLILGGELGNSTASTMKSMELVWPRMKALNVNTILVPVYWELLEPKEGQFDFELIDDLILESRKQELKIIFLWFASWKNSMSSHVPAWVKQDQKRFPRAKSRDGISQEILTPFSQNNLQADMRAYVALMKHIKEVDADHQTVIMMQPENEIGMLPSARDYHAIANKAFKSDVPTSLINYLIANKAQLNPEFYEIWKTNGFKESGNWETVFGEGLHTDEIFMAYYFAKYVDQIAGAGKQAYGIPAFVNAALNRPGKKPGEYPSAGPLPHLLDVWKAASPAIDFYSPDYYTPRFKHWNDLYVRQGNPLFIPEHRFDNTVAAKALYAIGHYEALGFAPFSIQQVPGMDFSEKETKLSETYDVIDQISPLISQLKGQGRIEGVLLDKETNESKFQFGNYEFTVGHTHNLGWEAASKAEEWSPVGAIIIHSGENEFYVVGFGVSLTMQSLKESKPNVGILKAERGIFEDGQWSVFQHLNGDQTHQGRHIRCFLNDVCIQRFTLYEYD
ncbi:MAG: DUF5597 domain-containing protein [Cyclobacteriaceae bacterium]